MNLTQIEGLLKFKMIQKLVAMQIVVTQNNQQHQKTNKQKNSLHLYCYLNDLITYYEQSRKSLASKHNFGQKHFL